MSRFVSPAFRTALSGVACIVLPTFARAQEQPAARPVGDTVPARAAAAAVTASTPTLAPTGAGGAAAIADTIEAGLVARTLAAIQGERDRWLGERRDAETRWATATTRAQAMRGEIAALERAIDTLARKASAARKEKRDADRAAAETERRATERALDIVRARREVVAAEGEQARLERDHADAAVRAADAEQAIAERRAVASHADPVQRLAFEELQSRWLQALRTREARNADVADRRFRVVEARLALLERERKR
jgi:chromosome segregation ATPase